MQQLVVDVLTVEDQWNGWLRFDGVLVAGVRGADSRSNRRWRYGGAAVQSDNADPHQIDKELEELEYGQQRKPSVETQNAPTVAEQGEQLLELTTQNTDEYNDEIQLVKCQVIGYSVQYV